MNHSSKYLFYLIEENRFFFSKKKKDFLGAEEAARFASESPDVEFEGLGDYEEAIYADWSQPKGKGDTGESNVGWNNLLVWLNLFSIFSSVVFQRETSSLDFLLDRVKLLNRTQKVKYVMSFVDMFCICL